jgi:hypothetical protein
MSDAKLIDEPPMLVLPSLATAIGLKAAVVLQQMHFRSRDADELWWRPTAAELRAEFQFIAPSTLARVLRQLERDGYVRTRQEKSTDRSKSYSVHYDAIDRLTSAPKRSDGTDQNASISFLKPKRGTAKKGERSAAKFSHLDGGTRTA